MWLRDPKIFKREKILTRFVAKEIIAAYDNGGKYYDHTLHSTYVYDTRFKPKYVLGLFNSELFKFYYKKTNSQGGDIFPQVRIESVKNLPIKLADNKTQNAIEIIVDKILTDQTKAMDTVELERQIDILVYKAYGITQTEQLVIEKNIG